jgi:hypothetical protein
LAGRKVLHIHNSYFHFFFIAEWAAATLNQQHPVSARATAGVHHNQQLNSGAVAHHPPHAICRAPTYYYIAEGGLPSCFTRRVLHFSTNPLFGNKYNSADNRICVCIKRFACGQKASKLPAAAAPATPNFQRLFTFEL